MHRLTKGLFHAGYEGAPEAHALVLYFRRGENGERTMSIAERKQIRGMPSVQFQSVSPALQVG